MVLWSLRSYLLLMEKMFNLIEIFVYWRRGIVLRLNSQYFWGRLRLGYTFKLLVINVRRLIRISSNVVIRFIHILDIGADCCFNLLHLLLFAPTLWRLPAIEVIVLLSDRLVMSHLRDSGPHLLSFSDALSSTVESRVDVILLLVRGKLVNCLGESVWGGA